MNLITADQHFQPHLFPPRFREDVMAHTTVERLIVLAQLARPETAPEIPETIADEPMALAEVNHGNWIARCPLPSCNGAERVSLTDRRFFCLSCNNEAVAGAWLRVAVPEDVGAITTLLVVRPNGMNRNWRPGEPIEQLERENALHLEVE